MACRIDVVSLMAETSAKCMPFSSAYSCPFSIDTARNALDISDHNYYITRTNVFAVPSVGPLSSLLLFFPF